MFEGYSLEMEVGVAPWTGPMTLDLIAENQLQAEQVHKGFIPTGRDYSYALFINISLCAPSTPSASQFLLPLLVVQTGDSNSWTNWNFLCSVFKFSEKRFIWPGQTLHQASMLCPGRGPEGVYCIEFNHYSILQEEFFYSHFIEENFFCLRLHV